ncbi:MAG: thiamine pyrophosphate-binding protein [Gammaproteobacteria bacterium]|nr:thiamine pyrophosphate-binding protein [Gammaproteobacteria bacterium]MDH3431464.1 thiamine pyrophosphate-binding protein [Gammaproteobacteria bacterium]MDH3433459.1 thiamine pyrophosphate-binding protein [Gammaproteobacteria bacterium]
MRNLVNDLMSGSLSRRGFLAGMAAASFAPSAARSALAAIEPLVPGTPLPEGFTRSVTGTGADILVKQLIEAGAEYLFVSNGSGVGPICDSLVDHPQLQLIQATQEGQTVSIADGYAKASGKTGFGMFSRVGLPHSSSNMYNSMKDRTPLVLFSDHAETDREGTDSHEDVDDWLNAVAPYTKWRWTARQPERIAEWVRKAYKISGVLPGGPTHVRIPRNVLYQANVTSEIYSREALHISMDLQPDAREVERAAKYLLEASSPLLYVGPEVSQMNARPALVELAELLAIPVMQHRSFHADFPNFHPLYLGELPALRSYLSVYPKPIDCFVNFGARFPVRDKSLVSGLPVIHASAEPTAIGRNTPLASALLGRLDLTAAALVEAIRSMATAAQLKSRTEERRSRCAAHTGAVRKARAEAGRNSKGSPVPWPRLMYELTQQMEKDAIVVEELGTEQKVLSYFPFGDGQMSKIGRTEGRALGWGVGASAGVKLAQPNRQVVSLQGDGGFLFGQTDSLWTMSRYDIPVMTVVTNNGCYEETRWQMMNRAGRAAKAGRDYMSRLGDPDVDFTKLAAAYDIPGAIVANTDELRPAIKRGLQTLREGRPFMLDVRTRTLGPGADLTWYPDFSVAKQRTRKV